MKPQQTQRPRVFQPFLDSEKEPSVTSERSRSAELSTGSFEPDLEEEGMMMMMMEENMAEDLTIKKKEEEEELVEEKEEEIRKKGQEIPLMQVRLQDQAVWNFWIQIFKKV